MCTYNLEFKAVQFSTHCWYFSILSIISIIKKPIKPALQPLLAHDAPPALSQHTTATLSERGSLPNFVSARQPTKHTATAAGSGEFSFFWSLDTVIAPVACSLRETIPREQIRDLPFTVKNNRAVHGLAWELFLHIYQITAALPSPLNVIPLVKRFSGNLCI